MNAPFKLHPHSPREDYQRVKQRHQRIQQIIGILLLIAGYASLAVSPDTPSDWVLLRVAIGFGLLFSGFGMAVLPWLSRISRGEE